MAVALGRSIILVPAIPFLLTSSKNVKTLPSSRRFQLVMTNSAKSRTDNDNTTIPLHNENLVRPETTGIVSSHAIRSGGNNDENDDDAELVFFNTFFCPYAQMTWIALNEKGITNKTEFVEGLEIRGGDYHVHPRLRALGRSGVPTLFHPTTGTVVDGSTNCVAFVDEHFGKEEPYQLIPADERLRSRAQHCERLLHSAFTFPFYSMLLRQEPTEQVKAKRNLLLAIEQLVEYYQGPYYLGQQFSIADIAVAPYFDRMVVLKHYRNFVVPQQHDDDDDEGGTAAATTATAAFAKWHEWSTNVLERPSVAGTRQDRDRIIEAYKRYAKCYVRNNWYERVFIIGH